MENIKNDIIVPDDFRILCDLYGITPQYVIQFFIDRISYPIFYSNIDDKVKWATLLFLDSLPDEPTVSAEEVEINEKYMDKLSKLIRDPNIEFRSQMELELRKVMEEWHKVVGRQRSKYLFDKLSTDESDNL